MTNAAAGEHTTHPLPFKVYWASSWVIFAVGCLVSAVAFLSMGKALADRFRRKKPAGSIDALLVGSRRQTIDDYDAGGLLSVSPGINLPYRLDDDDDDDVPASSLLFARKDEPEQAAVGPVILLIVKCLLPWPAVIRTLGLLINDVSFDADYLVRPWSNEDFYVVFVTSAPNYVLMATYLLLVMFWAWLYSYSRNSFPAFLSGLLSLWGVLVALEFLVWIVLLMLMAALPDHISLVHNVEEAYASVLSILVALLFIVWGTKLSAKLGSLPPSNITNLILTKVSALTVLCSVLFVVRSLLIVLCAWVFSVDGNQVALFVSIVIWVVGCEYLPTLLVTVILNWRIVLRK